ncbi:MAG: hypothetical protein PHG95_04085 [Patescibacteria group bacterium]|nr:hypothetical protein [Patescibacteria group bacterium]
MQEDELKGILAELYQFEPGLRDFEPELKVLIVQMADLRPDTRFTPALAAKIKTELFRRIRIDGQDNKKSFSFNIMNKKFVYAATAVMGVAIIALAINLASPLSRKVSEKNLADNNLSEKSQDAALIGDQDSVVRLAANAFGSLRSLAQAVPSHGKMVTAAGQEIGAVQAEFGPATGMGSAPSIAPDLAVTSVVTPRAAEGDNASVAFTAGSAGEPGIIDRKMIAPWFGYTYVYKGDKITLKAEDAIVYRRLKSNDNASASRLLSLIGNLDLNGLSLNTFNNLSATNLSLQENKDKGLAINFDFLENTVSIYENYQQWRILERENCGSDEACWQKFRIKIANYPTDEYLIALSDGFLAGHNINTSHYGSAIVDNTWRQDYERSGDKDNYYIPEYASVVYPLLIEGNPVRDQNGNYFGLRVSVNILQKAVSGLSNFSPYRYESSSYELETSVDRILKAAVAGGLNRSFYGSSEEMKELFLGTPERSFVQIYRYADNRNDELMVPALVFPIIDKPAAGYYGQNYVVVPLVKELLDELENGQGGMEIIPMVKAAR